MMTDDLTQLGFARWFAFAIDREKELLGSLPGDVGVYVIAFSSPVDRRVGCSDIAYIGAARNKQGIRHRVRQYFHPGWDNKTSLRIQRYMLKNPDLRLACKVTGDKVRASTLEASLLAKFEAEHGELPPFNKQRAWA